MIGSYARFIVGAVLAAEILREVFSGQTITVFAIGLSLVYLILTIWFFVSKFILR